MTPRNEVWEGGGRGWTHPGQEKKSYGALIWGIMEKRKKITWGNVL